VIAWRARRVLRLAGKSIWLHRLRSLLTALGMVFGVGAVVAMLAVGEGASRDAQRQYLRLGSRNLIVRSVKPTDSASAGASASRSWTVTYGLTLDDVKAVETTVPGLSRLVPRRDLPYDLWNGARKVVGSVFATTPDYREVTNLVLEQGRFLTEADSKTRSNVCVLGAAVADGLFPAGDALTGTVRVAADYWRVVGVVGKRGTAPASGAGASGEEDTAIFVPLDAGLERFSTVISTRTTGSRTSERVELHQLVAEARTPDDVPAAAAALRALLSQRHPKGDFRVTVPLELLEEAARSKRLFTIVLALVGGLSLLVGGIGIMNIMLASVTERTREIGVRRALGARRRDIVAQFLAETVLLSGGGGALGLLLGPALALAIRSAFDVQTYVTPISLAVAFSVSAGVGVVFGLYPAGRAADLDPVEALRHD
jgi:putative ABC transport system permease protein